MPTTEGRPAPDGHLAAVVGAAADALVGLARDGTILSWNPAAERLFGVPAAEAVGASIVTTVPDDRRAEYEAATARVHAGETVSVETVRLARDGRRLDVRWTVAPILDAAGAVVGRAATFADLGERRLLEHRLALALESAEDGLWDWDMTTGASFLSPRWCALLGYAPDELTGHADSWIALLHPDDRDRVWANVQAHVASDAPQYAAEQRLRHRDGYWVWVQARGKVVARDAGGRATRMIGTIHDITPRKEAELALREREARLSHLHRLEAVGQLAGGIAHEFNNLLTVVLGHAEVARQAIAPGHDAHDDLAQVQAAGERARVLVRQLLAFGRRQWLRLQSVDLATHVPERCAALLAPVLGGEVLLRVEVDAPPGTALGVHVDVAQLDQVLVNLALNARDAMRGFGPARPAAGTLTFALDAHALDAGAAAAWAPLEPGAYVRLRVRDTGHGMDAETRRRAFEPFYTTKPVGEGTGLGLPMVEGIVAQSGGAVRVESAPGAGACFTLLFPAA
ncbi:PAS domain-containing sensor histidine kinase [Roseisolibacter sp. H3M3-2]|uniref:PAS domain-containing sensor histidine kinase n=1 Tax=Roseisolibacter sp. H3M3-2 TaxID=3031323 RepID=UPI0023DCC01A|nr:PAS domain-containing sensor histidine kinase [Roseisolibacter sp. H3M3-2]MDF1504059.1 PAS domain-containing protein [Roseisolibacter sp. H3M3-2]